MGMKLVIYALSRVVVSLSRVSSLLSSAAREKWKSLYRIASKPSLDSGGEIVLLTATQCVLISNRVFLFFVFHSLSRCLPLKK